MKVYFAGPDVFYPNYAEHVEHLTILAKLSALEPLFPGETLENNAQIIAQCNLDLIKKTDILIANLNPFRGQEPDSGTVFECGYAVALRKPVLGYLTDHRDQLTKLRLWIEGPTSETTICLDGSHVEDFGLPLNLMLAFTVRRLYNNVEEAIIAASNLRDI